jgi:DNA modification methylase
MFWLLKKEKQKEIRERVDKLVHALAAITDNPHLDQTFPYVGRKDRRKAEIAINHLSEIHDIVIEPFAGSGTFVYACNNQNREVLGNEWEPYANRMANAPWRLPEKEELYIAYEKLNLKVSSLLKDLYKTICVCGHVHVLDSMFFDRVPLEYINVQKHERLGPNDETITYRQKYKCPVCKRTQKKFDESDLRHINEVNSRSLSPKYATIFSSTLIENSRINLTGEFTIYGNMFPHRSKVALSYIWDNIEQLPCEEYTKDFFKDTFLSILPQAKYKDYRSKSQDLHCPPVMLREVNLWNRFYDQLNNRYKVISEYVFSGNTPGKEISCHDFRQFLSSIETESADLIFTDPPWTDGNAYFEKAQLYHPWLDYCFKNDVDRLAKEFVVTDAPSRRNIHNTVRWWNDLDDLFIASYKILKANKFFAFYFRPIPASQWLKNLNDLKFHARKNGFEPILSIDVGSSDPSMRIQQSASFVFSTDIIFLFLKLDEDQRRIYHGGQDIDYFVFHTAELLQEEIKQAFTYKNWRANFSQTLAKHNLNNLNKAKDENWIYNLFLLYCDQVQPGLFLTKPLTPFTGQIYDTPVVERFFTYIPIIVNELSLNDQKFSYDSFLLKLAEYVENGTRSLIEQLNLIDIKHLIEPYAEALDEGRWFVKRNLPAIPQGIKHVYDLDPYQFEAFVAKLFEAQGFTDVVLAGRSGDRGVDIIAKDPKGEPTVIQCKRWLGNVSATPIQRVHSFAITRGATRKLLVTTSDYTPQAIEEAVNTNTELINGKILEELISKYIPGFFN